MYSSHGVARRIGGNGKNIAWRILLLGMGLGSLAVAHGATLDPAMLPKIEAATFEVVQAKPLTDPLTYEKPLPLELLPYQERTDKYYSIGTAFAIGHNRYVTAGHVLLAGVGSLWGAPELRDSKGHVYAIDKVEKFSLRKDFVVFSLASPPADDALKPDTRPALNQVVYSVGNALGTGIVIRDGLYTSDTPEQQDGSWKWMRFSAAASPGNSGGPLLDASGKLIGVVLMKSANENLNYALPIGQVLEAPDHQAIIDTRTSYQLDIFDARQNGLFKAQFSLPMTLGDFYRNLQDRTNANSETELKALLAKESANLFPNGEGSSRLLFQQTQLDGFPTLIVRGSNGEWGRAGSSSQHFSLSGNGYVDVGGAGRNGLVHLRRPDDMDAARFYGDAKTRMDLLASTGMFQRTVASEKIKITSLGKPILDTVYTDRWQRPWRVEVWPLPYANGFGVVYSLPVPDGSVMLSRMTQPANLHDTRLDMDQLSNFIYVTYEGTLKQWTSYLKDSTLQPAAFKNIHLDFDYGRRFGYASSRVSFAYGTDVQAITPDSLLWLGFRFFMDGGKAVWDVGDIDVWKDSTSDNHDGINIQRFMPPPPDLDKDMSSRWQQLTQHQFPYNGVARPDGDLMKINAVSAPAGVGGKSPAVLYTAYYGVAGAASQAEMKRKLDLLMKNLQVKEH
ncbi:serine protease [Rhodanobacter sp. B05]|uniref:S1 family peptidase n=1 Tax=Rhodanobacter sp. B05 TaxID=1945859 RepID=UPI000985EAD4|nr:serine protease [Rhodanobacter sp. B05]